MRNLTAEKLMILANPVLPGSIVEARVTRSQASGKVAEERVAIRLAVAWEVPKT